MFRATGNNATGTQNHLLFLCYGAEPIFRECAFALLTLSAHPDWQDIPGFSIWIYTDNPEWFAAFTDCPLPLNFRTLDEATIKSWRGAVNFTHRVKIELLRDFTATHSGNILYADTDVVFRAPLASCFSRIASGQLLMHVREGRVDQQGNPILQKLHRYLSDSGAVAASGVPLGTFSMWNAGVLGFTQSRSALLEQVLTFTDLHYSRFPKHIVEQFAFSVVFAENGPVKTTAPVITHYWNLKEVREVLASFFQAFASTPWAELTRLSQLIQVDVLMQEKSNFYINRSIAGKMRKEKWRPQLPDWQDCLSQL
jgi:hypothetical protein